MEKITLAVLIASSIMVHSATAAPPSIDLRDAWKGDSGELARAVQAGAGFSFRYDGKSVGPEIPSEWQQTFTDDTKTGATQTVLTHGSGLVVTREMRVLPGFGAVEYRLRFKNTASKTLPAVSALRSLDITFGKALADGTCVVSSGGGLADGFLPPRNFAIRRNCFAPTVPDGGRVELTTQGGRSSNKDLPFFFIQNDELQQGLFVAFGWSGQWAAVVQRDPAAGTLGVKGWIPDLNIALEPGEEIQGPTIMLGLYQGAVAEGSNQLRRLIRDVYAPKLAGKTFQPIATYDHWWNIADDFDEALLKKLADGAAAIGQEYFLLDAGWFAGPAEKDGWIAGVGNWEEVDKKKLPRGLKPVADYVRSKGLKFGLWFEPERVAEGTKLANEHPDWVLWEHGAWTGSLRFLQETSPDHAFFKKRQGLLDYGRPEVQQWVRNMLDRYISEYGVKYIRYDFNIDPLPYWDAVDKPNRSGVAQLRHIQGLYSIIDWIGARHPDTVLEGCASGGRRIDLETVRRFHTAWISDYTVDPAIIRFHLAGINHFLPGNYSYIQYTLPSPNQKDFRPDDLGFQSMFGGAFGTGGRVDLWPQAMQQKARLHVETWKKVRRYLMEDYYPLNGQPGDLESWSGWQFQDPKDRSGFIQTFRTQTPDSTHRFALHKLESQARYRFTDAYGTQSFEVTGSEAITKGIEVAQDPMSSKVFTYRKL